MVQVQGTAPSVWREIAGQASNTESGRIARNKLETKFASGRSSVTEVMEKIEATIPHDLLAWNNALNFKETDYGVTIDIPGQNNSPTNLSVHKHALQQLADEARIPKKFIDVLVNDKQSDLLAHVLNERFHQMTPDRHMARTVDGQLMGWLSMHYKRLDTPTLAMVFFEECHKLGAVPAGGKYMDTKSVITMMLPYCFEPFPGEVLGFGMQFWKGDFGGVSCSAQNFVERLLCLNGMTGRDGLRKIHLGKEMNEETFSNPKIIELQTELVAEQIRETIRRCIAPDAVREKMAVIKVANEKDVNIRDALEAMRKGAKLTKEEAARCTELYNTADIELLPPVSGRPKKGEGSLWRLSNVLSLLAQETEGERILELQSLAGETIGLNAA